MPTINVQNLSVAANTTTTNQLAGDLYEFLPGDALVTLLASAAAVGLNASFHVGGNIVLNDQAVPQSNRFPIDPDDSITMEGGLGAERLFLTFRNTTGAAIIVNAAVKIDLQ